MNLVEKPEVFLVSRPSLDWPEILRYLRAVNGTPWADDKMDDLEHQAEHLVELGGRLCYRSWLPGLNPNVTKVRDDSREYHHNILKSGHGSVLQHANFSFIFHQVSRVFTHELVRHAAGTAFSQESMRFVRLTDIPFWFPVWARKDPELMKRSLELLDFMEQHQRWMAYRFHLDDPGVPFAEKKHKTSFMRRFAPDGVATGVLATFNVRSLRHIVAMRTAIQAEEEIRIVLDDTAEIMLKEIPNLMQDYSVNENREWIPEFLKV